MSRKKRQTEKIFKIFCEGDTEYNYFEYIRKNSAIKLAIKPINMNGGGYLNYLSKIKEDANSNCVAKFVVIDGDRACSVSGELAQLKNIINYCILQNDNKTTPHILIINFPDFEYVACLHTISYKGQKTEQYIKQCLKYSDLESFKSDKNLYKILTQENKGSINQLLQSINSNTAVIHNEFSYNKSKYELFVKTEAYLQNLGIKGTNFNDFYNVLDIFETKVKQ